ncbi:MFS transporter [Bacillus licheniformis]|nr:MFS transporter [Bacillus licheniformis]
MRRIVFLGIGIAVVQQITGVNSIMYYGTEILKMPGLKLKLHSSAILQTVSFQYWRRSWGFGF